MKSRTPLHGRNIYVTRPEHQAASLVQKIKQAGGNATVVPAITLSPPKETEALQSALRDLQNIDIVIFTSVNGVKAVARTLDELGIPADSISSRTIAAIGPATASELQKSFRAPDIVPDEFISDALPAHLGDVRGKRILLPRADIARKNLAEVLAENGAEVLDVAAYRVTTNCDANLISELKARKEEERPDCLTATSSSTVLGLRTLLEKADKAHWLNEVPLFCIGPITAQTAKECGVENCVVANEYTTDGLLEAILEWEKTHE